MKNILIDLLYDVQDARIETIADYLTKNGVVYIPCKVGNIVYQTDGLRIYELTILHIYLHKNNPYYETDGVDFDNEAIGKSIFLTKKQARQRQIELLAEAMK